MDILLSFLLMTFTVIDFTIVFKILANTVNRKNGQHLAFCCMCISNAISLIGYFVMLLQDSPNVASYIGRMLGIVGILFYCVFVVYTYYFWSGINKTANTVILIIWFCAVAFLIPTIVSDSTPIFFKSAYGITYSYINTPERLAYICYKCTTLILLICFTVQIWKKSSATRMRRIDYGILGCDIAILLELLIDIFLVQTQMAFFPFNAILFFVANTLMYHILLSESKNHLTISNLAGYAYYNLNMPILIFDEIGKVVIANECAIEKFDIEREDILGKEFDDFYPIRKEQLFEEEQVRAIACKKNDYIYDLSISKLYDRYNEVLGYLVLSTDVTEQNKALVQVEESRQLAEAANRAKGDFLANMSHEIRTPINAILGMDEMILRETKDKFIVKYASDIKTAGSSLLAIVNDVLDFSKIESGKMEIQPKEYDTEKIICDVINVMLFKARQKGLKFVYDIDSRLPKRLYGDDLRIRQIITNLLSNAIKFTNKGRVMFSVRGYRIDEKNVDVQIAVADTGCGIKKEDIPNLFVAFNRLNDDKNYTLTGTGLGLKITHEILMKMNGVMDVKSTYGKGSTFSCSFRQEIKDGDEIGDFEKYYETHQSNSYTYHKTFEASNASVLVVDDNQMNLAVIENLLKETKMNIVSVLGGKEAVESAHINEYDIILMDHMMPIMDGLEAYTAIRNDKTGCNQNTPIIAMTANAVDGAKQMYLDYGFSEYIPKPVEPALLEAILMRFIPIEKIEFTNTSVEDWVEDEGSDAEEFKKIELYLESKGINAITGLRNMNNNIVNYQETLKLFVKSFETKRNLMKKLLVENEAKNYGIEAHALKSNARIIGADTLSSIAYKHEMAGKEYRISSADSMWDDLIKEWTQIVRTIDEYLKQVDFDREIEQFDDRSLKEISDSELKEKLLEIKEFVEDYDHIEAKNHIEYLMDYKISAEVRKKVKEAYKCLEAMDYDSADDVMCEIVG